MVGAVFHVIVTITIANNDNDDQNIKPMIGLAATIKKITSQKG